MRARALALRLTSTLAIAAILSSASAIATPVLAQGKKPATSAEGGKPAAAPAAKKTPPGQAKKQVSPNEAVVLSRELLVKHGFQVVRVETVKGSQIIYYSAGNRGRGKGIGPVQQMILRPAGSIVSFEAVPEKVRLDIKLQLGF